MPSNVILSKEEEEDFESNGGLKAKTLDDRRRFAAAFLQFWADNSNAEKIEDCVKTEVGCEKISLIFSKYFWSMRVSLENVEQLLVDAQLPVEGSYIPVVVGGEASGNSNENYGFYSEEYSYGGGVNYVGNSIIYNINYNQY